MKAKILLLFAFLILFQGNSQSLRIFDTSVNVHRIDFCEFVQNKFSSALIGVDFTYYKFTSRTEFYGIKYNGQWNGLAGNWYFVIRFDTLNQFGFSLIDKEVNKYNYLRLYNAADSAINYFTAKYGSPIKEDSAKHNDFRMNVRKALWLINGQKLLVRFFYDHEYSEFSFKIERFEDYDGDFELTEEIDGY